VRRWIGQARSPRGIIAHQQQSLAGLVQPADGRKPGKAGVLQQCIDRVAAALVQSADHQSTRLVDGDANPFAHLQRLAVHFDPVRCGIGRHFRITHHSSIHTHAS